MSRIKEHFHNIINSFKEPPYDAEYGEWRQEKLEELHKLDELLEDKALSNREEIEQKRALILQELNG